MTNSKNRFITPLLFLPMLFLFFLPSVTYSIPSDATRDGKTGITYECGDGSTAGNCTFADLVAATKKVINWAVSFALFFSVIVIAYAGYKYLTSGANAGERTKANKMLQSVAIGIAWVLAAWLIVNLITTELLGSGLETIFPK